MMRIAIGVAALLAPGLAWAADDSQGVALAPLLWQAANLAILVAVILKFTRQPIRDFFVERRRGIQKNLQSSAELLAQAESRLAEWQERTDRLDGEIEEIRATSRQLAEQERQRILDQAEQTAERIRRDAQAVVEQEVRQARQALRAEAADLAVELAGNLIRDAVCESDRERLFDEFVERIESTGPERPSAGEN